MSNLYPFSPRSGSSSSVSTTTAERLRWTTTIVNNIVVPSDGIPYPITGNVLNDADRVDGNVLINAVNGAILLDNENIHQKLNIRFAVSNVNQGGTDIYRFALVRATNATIVLPEVPFFTNNNAFSQLSLASFLSFADGAGDPFFGINGGFIPSIVNTSGGNVTITSGAIVDLLIYRTFI